MTSGWIKLIWFVDKLRTQQCRPSRKFDCNSLSITSTFRTIQIGFLMSVTIHTPASLYLIVFFEQIHLYDTAQHRSGVIHSFRASNFQLWPNQNFEYCFKFKIYVNCIIFFRSHWIFTKLHKIEEGKNDFNRKEKRNKKLTNRFESNSNANATE